LCCRRIGFSVLLLISSLTQELTLELISQGADVCAATFETKNNPLHFATRNSHKCVVEILLRSGADPSIPNSHGLIPAELTNDKNISSLLMRTNWISQRPKQYEESLEEMLQSLTLSRPLSAVPPPPPHAVTVSDASPDSESRNKKTITIAIPESKSELNLPYQGHTKSADKDSDKKREKPSRRYSLPAGAPPSALALTLFPLVAAARTPGDQIG
jgi:ankyrin repeat protein